MAKAQGTQKLLLKGYNLWVTGSSQTCQTGPVVFYLVLPHLGQIPATRTEQRNTKPWRHVRTRPVCLDSRLKKKKHIVVRVCARACVLTAGRIHKVLLLDWHRISRRCLVHLQQGLARVLPGGCLFNVAIRKKDSGDITENGSFTLKTKQKKNNTVNFKPKSLASHAEKSMTQSWFNEHFENSRLSVNDECSRKPNSAESL